MGTSAWDPQPGVQPAVSTRAVSSELSAGDVAAALDHIADGVVVLGPDWRCRHVNAPAGRLLDRAPAALVGRDMWSALPDLVGSALHRACQDVVRTGEPATLIDADVAAGRWIEHRVLPQGDDLVVVLRDVSDRHAAAEELREYAARMAEAERIVRFGVWKWEIATNRVRWSDELHRIYGLRPGQFAGTVDAFMERLHPDDREAVGGHIARSLETLEPFSFEERIVRADGRERVLLSQGRVLTGPDGAPEALVGECHDVTDRAHAERALGASERRMRAIIDNTPSGICVKDLTGRYLMANAEYGHIAGVPADELVGQRCRDAFPPEIAEPQRAIDVEAATENEPVFAEAQLDRDGEPRSYVTVTFALPDDHGRPVETCTIVTDVTERREREGERRERRRWAERLTSALVEDRIRVLAQPVIDLVTGACVSHELLSRLLEDGEVLAPAAFLPAAERFGLVQQLDVHVIRRALALPDGVAPQVNLSAVTMGDAGARREILDVLAAAPSSARRRLVFEITETAAAAHLEAAREFAAAITELGCRLALDDFGTGFGSFTYLRALPLSYLKIDRSFVRDLVTAPDDRRVVQSIIGIAQQFGLQTIAEGVEDAATLDLLRELGADHAQGFHLGRPGDLPEPA